MTINHPPSPSFTMNPSRAAVDSTVTFVSTSADVDGSVAAVAWDLDADGAFDDASGPNAARAFAAGPHIVSLRATDDRGVSTIAFQTVQVSGPIPTALATPGLGLAGPVPAPPLRGAGPGSGRPLLLSPFPVVRIRGAIVRGGIRVQVLSVGAGRGARIDLSCAGRSCPLRRLIRVVRTAGRPVRFRPLERRLRPGVVLEIRVTTRGRLGEYTRFTLRRAAAPARLDMCMRWQARKPTRCPVQ